MKSKEAEKYQKNFDKFVPEKTKQKYGSAEIPIAIVCLVYNESALPDLNIEIIKDSLQNSNVISNDRYIVAQYEYRFIDPDNPRTMIFLFEITEHNDGEILQCLISFL